MKKIMINESKEVTREYATLADYVSAQRTPDKDNKSLLSLVRYNPVKDDCKVYVIDLNLIPITDITCFRDIVAYHYYSQLSSINDKLIDKLEDQSKQDMLTSEDKHTLECAKEYKSELDSILALFETPVDSYNNKSIKSLANTDIVSQYISGTLTGQYPDTMVLNEVVQTGSKYYEILSMDATKEVQKQGYLSARTALEKACNILSFADTCYSKEYKNHANSVLTKSVVTDIVSRYYKGRSINGKTGRVQRKVDTKGANMRKELVLACLEKFHK